MPAGASFELELAGGGRVAFMPGDRSRELFNVGDAPLLSGGSFGSPERPRLVNAS